jgi:hypothetical protein
MHIENAEHGKAQPPAALRKTDITNRVDLTTRPQVNQLQPGERVEVDHEVKVGSQRWTTVTTGKVVRIERRRQGLHFRRNPDDKVFADLILLELPDGSLTTVSLDDFTQIRRIG